MDGFDNGWILGVFFDTLSQLRDVLVDCPAVLNQIQIPRLLKELASIDDSPSILVKNLQNGNITQAQID